ncbi:pectate lyase family protein [Nonomuraea sp. H19]|uniref:pectate lyase family protein n=1 Tax=Nonomuraea sp. H19 TaxID=3452206 RepID=UPI003F8A89A0
MTARRVNNWFQNVNSRVPLTRRSHVHMLNDYFQDVADTAVNARMGAQVLAEGNQNALRPQDARTQVCRTPAPASST